MCVQDIDECYERDGICRDGECTNLDGSFQCICHNGYALTASRDTCVDVDECSRHPNVCNNGTCLNSVGSFKCNCSDGFKLSHNNDCIGTHTHTHTRLTFTIQLTQSFDWQIIIWSHNYRYDYFDLQTWTSAEWCRSCAETVGVETLWARLAASALPGTRYHRITSIAEISTNARR
jgi:hypothetical protein